MGPGGVLLDACTRPHMNQVFLYVFIVFFSYTKKNVMAVCQFLAMFAPLI